MTARYVAVSTSWAVIDRPYSGIILNSTASGDLHLFFNTLIVTVGAAVLMAAAAPAARAQAFADLKASLVDYSKADMEPFKMCDTLGQFKSKEIVQITAALMPAAAAAPAHCRVTGLLSPEIAFEVS